MKVFIVTAGGFNEYRIAGVFSSKEAATNYIKTVPDANEIEEWEVHKEAGKIFTAVCLWMRFDENGFPIGWPCSGWIEYDPFWCVFVRKRSTIDCTPEEANEMVYRKSLRLLILTCSINKENPTDKEINQLKDRYRKVMVEIYSQIRFLVEKKGWTEEMVNKWLKDKTRKGEI